MQRIGVILMADQQAVPVTATVTELKQDAEKNGEVSPAGTVDGGKAAKSKKKKKNKQQQLQESQQAGETESMAAVDNNSAVFSTAAGAEAAEEPSGSGVTFPGTGMGAKLLNVFMFFINNYSSEFRSNS